MIHLLRAWVHAVGLSVGQVPCSEKSNEFDALPRLLDSLSLRGATVSIDAMGCHPEIAAQLQQTVYYLSSLPAEAPALAQHIRGHWAVENT